MVSIETTRLVIDFYRHNENSRIMPGMKDRISIKKNVYQQKRLIVCTLEKLHSAFRQQQQQEHKIGFSKFCMLRSKWCILAGSSGTDSVCVCTIHQNIILLLHAIQMKET